MALELTIQPQYELISREDLAALAQSKGLSVTIRTLRYWAERGWIPRPLRIEGEGLRAYYPKALLERVRVLAAIRPYRISAIRENVAEVETVQFGEDSFSVLPAIARWERDNTEFTIQMLEDGTGMLLIQRKKGKKMKERKGKKMKEKSSS